MPGSGGRRRLEDILPEQLGERRISVHWFFLPVAIFWLAAGIACLRHGPLPNGSTLTLIGWFCVFLGLFGLLTFVLCVMRIRAGRPPQALFTIRVRPMIFIGSLFGYLALCVALLRFSSKFTESPWLTAIWMITWVVGAKLIGSGIIRYFHTHPPKRKFTIVENPSKDFRK